MKRAYIKPRVRLHKVHLRTHLLSGSYVEFSNESGSFDVKGYNNDQGDAKSDRNLWDEDW